MEDMILYLEYTISEWSKASILVLLQVLPWLLWCRELVKKSLFWVHMKMATPHSLAMS